MLTPPLQEIKLALTEIMSNEKNVQGGQGRFMELLNALEQMDFLEAALSKAFAEGGLVTAARVIVKPAYPDCQICGRTIFPKTS